jgi:hypothetical protein
MIINLLSVPLIIVFKGIAVSEKKDRRSENSHVFIEGDFVDQALFTPDFFTQNNGFKNTIDIINIESDAVNAGRGAYFGRIEFDPPRVPPMAFIIDIDIGIRESARSGEKREFIEMPLKVAFFGKLLAKFIGKRFH